VDQGIIRRKLVGAARAAAAPESGAERALPLALARAARDGFGLVLECPAVRSHRYSLAELLELPPERGLILLLEGPRAAMGAMILSPDLLAGLIEAQTLGRVSAQPVLPRKPTRTDAAMVADWADQVLLGLEEGLLAEEDLVWTDGFRYASYLDEARPLALLLEDTAYKVLVLRCDLGGVRQGDLILALPAEGHGRRPHRAPPQPGPEPAQGADFQAALVAGVMEAEVVVQGVLTRITLPLSALLALAPGAVLHLPQAALDRIELAGLDGRCRGLARLGQARGQRALRLSQVSGQEAAPAAVAVTQPDAPALPLAKTG